jgi:hypothetical protein
MVVINLGQRKDLSGGMHTEIENQLKETDQFFEELDFPAGTQVLQTLEAKIFMK